MIYTTLTNQAMQVAYAAHHGQFDCNGVPYIFHPYHLAEQMPDEITACVALLHDVLEDTPVTMAQLQELFPPVVTEALFLLTHQADTAYLDYVRAIRQNPVARTVKLADLAHNADQSRITDPDAVSAEKKAYWQQKYAEAIHILES